MVLILPTLWLHTGILPRESNWGSRNSLICRQVLGARMGQMACFLLGPLYIFLVTGKT
jgi:hypothetical protein